MAKANGKYNQPVKVNEYKGDNPTGNGDGKGTSIARDVWNKPELYAAAVRTATRKAPDGQHHLDRSGR
jgi:hypothetical protein